MDRRGFLKLAVGLLSAVVGGVVGIPFIAALVAPGYRKNSSSYAHGMRRWAVAGGQPVSRAFSYETQDAFIRRSERGEVWVVKHSDIDVTVFSPVCTHLGCRCDWSSADAQFLCPCHGSRFSLTGQVLGGPAPRPMDELPHKIENGQLYVTLERYQSGVPEKKTL